MSTAPGEDRRAPLVVPWDALERDTLRRVIESVVLREGTDYGAFEYSLEQKVAHVHRQLESGDASLVFDPATETVQIVPSGKAPATPGGCPAT